MTVTDFKSFRKQVYEAGTTLGSTGHFAEAVLYRPVEDLERTIVVAIHEDALAPNTNDAGELNLERIWVNCAKDPECARGGIDVPTSGDTIIREGDLTPWSYAGERQHETPHSWSLLYVRPRLRRGQSVGHPIRL